MHNYNNFIFDSFRNNVKATPVNKSGEQPCASTGGCDKTDTGSEISNVTPDYNVAIPTGYTKLGIEKLSNGQEIHCYKLNNGQKVYIAPKESSKTVLNTYVNTGALNEKDDERGISHFCEHMAFNGTKGTQGYMKLGKGDVFRIAADIGGYTNASTNYAETNYTISIPKFKKEDFETIVKMQSSMMNNLEMSEEMTDKEHGPVTSEINMYADIPDAVITNVAVKNLYNIQTTSKDIVAGTVDNILNVDSKKVMDYYKNNYFPSNMTTVVTGNVDPDEAINLLAKHFNGTNPQNPDRRVEPLNPIQKPVREDVISPKAVGTTGCLCFSGPANNDVKGNIEIMALNHLLFNKKHSIVSKALEPYNVEVQAIKEKIRTQPTDSVLLALNYTTTEENSELTLKSIYDKISNFTPPSEEEMQTLKTAMKMRFEKQYDDMEGLNYLIGQNALNGGIEGCTDAIKVIDSLTSQDLVNAVHKYYDLNKVSIAVIHPESVNAQTISENHSKAGKVSFKGLNNISDNTERKPIKTENISKYKLSNNCDIALVESNNDIGTFSSRITCTIPADTKPGVKELLEEILLKGSNNVVNLLDKNNITTFAGADNGSMFYNAEFPAQNTSVAMKIMKQAMMTPNFDAVTFEKAKKDLKTYLSTVQPSAYDNAQGALFPNSTRGYTKDDILKNIDNVKLEDVMGLHKYILDNGGFTFAASLPINKYPAVKNVVDNELSELPQFKENKPNMFNDYQPVEKSKVVTEISNTAQADIAQIYKFPQSTDAKDVVTYKLMNAILARGKDTGLFNNLREKEKLAYAVSSGLNLSNMTSGLLTCTILTTTDSADLKSYDNVQKSINGFTTQINKMKSGDFTEKELEAAKQGLKSNLLESFEDKDAKVETLSRGLNSVNGIENNNLEYNIIDSITKDDIQKAANIIFANKPIYSVRATKNTLEANKAFFESLEK